MVNSKGDFYLSLVLLFFSGFVFREALKFPKEAAYFPKLFSALLAILALILLLNSLRRKAGMAESKEHNYRNAALLVVGLVAFASLLKVLGYIAATSILVIYTIYVLGYRDFKKIILTTFIGITCVYIVFKILLGVPLPNFIFGI